MGKILHMLPVLLLVGAWLVLSTPAGAGQKIPEKLVYSLSWTGINVGTATQEIGPPSSVKAPHTAKNRSRNTGTRYERWVCRRW